MLSPPFTKGQRVLMVPELVVCLVVAGFIAFGALMLRMGRKQNERARRNAADLASNLGLDLEPASPKFGLLPPPRATGLMNGRRTRIFTYVTGSGKSRRMYCAISVQPRERAGMTFSFSRQGFETKVAQLFGAREITVGDPAFDQTWFIQTNQPAFLQAALLPELRTRLTAALDDEGKPYRWGTLKLESDEIVYAEHGDFSNERRCARLKRLAAVLSDFAAIAEVHARHARPGS